MIIKAKPLPPRVLEWLAVLATKFFRRRFNKMVIHPADLKPGHSYILMCNHFSFLDGFLAVYLCLYGMHRKHKLSGFYIMSLKKQLEKNRWLRYIGAFSIVPGSRSMEESLSYAAEILSKPGNVLLFYPQGNLESQMVRHIEFKDGLAKIVALINGNCQLIWSSNLMEYFESTKPSVNFNMLDCGTNKDFDFQVLKQQVNKHHLKSIQKNIRFTTEPE